MYENWKIALLHKCLTPFYALFKIIFKKSIIVIQCLYSDEGKNVGKYRETYDYVRIRTLGLLADMVKYNIESEEYAVAELGVYRGNFAARIQDEFPDKRIYLFDTFEGYPEKDKLYDIQSNFSKKNIFRKKKDFALTSVPLVLNKMSNPENVTICKGFFPDSVTEEHKKIKWGFVSLDVNLYQPTLWGLRFFYPSLCVGGFIMIHDYHNPHVMGVKQAVADFEAETTPLIKVPIPDSSGSLIITK